MTPDNSRAAFLELYISLTSALATGKRLKRFPELKIVMTDARRLHGEALTSLIVQWHMETASVADAISASDEKLLEPGAIPQCMAVLCLDRLFADRSFTQKSRENLWRFVHGLVLHSTEYTSGEDIGEGNDDDIPDPSKPNGETEPAFGFGCSSEAQMKAVQDLTSALPPQIMNKMHTLATEIQTGLSEGKLGMEDLSFNKILQDIVGTLNKDDIMSFVGNIDGVLKTVQTSPELQELMKSLHKNPLGESTARKPVPAQ